MLLFILLQAAQPDVAFYARARAREVTIERKGEARLTVTTEPEGGNKVDVIAPRADGRRVLRDVEVIVRAEARIGQPDEPAPPPRNNPDQAETSPPQ